MPTPRSGLAVSVSNGTLYAVGGLKPGPADTFYTTVEAYSPVTDSWTTKASLPGPCAYGSGAAINGIPYVVGCGDSTLLAYDPKSDTWVSKAPMPTPRQGVAVAAANGLLFAVGGVKVGILNTDYNVVEAYEPATNSWITTAPMPTARYSSAVGVINGLIYVAGGARTVARSVFETLGTLEVYDPIADEWTPKAPMPVPVRTAASVVIAGKLYVAGGISGVYPDSAQDVLQVYDPHSNSWDTGPAMSTPRFLAAAGVVDDTLYVVGGYPALSLNEAFSPFLHIAIDIKPGDGRNTINLKSLGTVPVAILGSGTFDPLSVDPSTVTLAGAPVATRGRGVPMTSQGDFNHDGYLDLLLHFRTQDLQLTLTSTEAVLYGETTTGQRIRGADTVRIVPPRRVVRFDLLPRLGRSVLAAGL